MLSRFSNDLVAYFISLGNKIRSRKAVAPPSCRAHPQDHCTYGVCDGLLGSRGGEGAVPFAIPLGIPTRFFDISSTAIQSRFSPFSSACTLGTDVLLASRNLSPNNRRIRFLGEAQASHWMRV